MVKGDVGREGGKRDTAGVVIDAASHSSSLEISEDVAVKIINKPNLLFLSSTAPHLKDQEKSIHRVKTRKYVKVGNAHPQKIKCVR